MTELVPGAPAPAFSLPDAGGVTHSLTDYAGGKVILYFYPAALTPGCTVQALDYSPSLAAFRDAGYAILGVSPDAPEKLARFTAKHDLTVTLLSDPDHATLEAYGAWGERNVYGKIMTGVIRSTFVIAVDADGAGRIEEAQYGVRATGHVARLRTVLGILAGT